MRITERQVGTTAVIDITGPIQGRAVGIIGVSVREQIRAGHSLVVLNLERVPSVDLAGLSALVEAYGALREAGGELRLAGVTKRIRDLVVIARPLTIFETFDSVEEAAEGAGRAYAGTPTGHLSRYGLHAIQRFLRPA